MRQVFKYSRDFNFKQFPARTDYTKDQSGREEFWIETVLIKAVPLMKQKRQRLLQKTNPALISQLLRARKAR